MTPLNRTQLSETCPGLPGRPHEWGDAGMCLNCGVRGNGWYLVTSTAGETYVTPQFAVLASSEDDAVRTITETSVAELNALLPADRQLKVGSAEWIGGAR